MTRKKTVSRDELRAATLGKKQNFSRKLVEVNGQQFEIRQLSLKGRSDLKKKCSFRKDEEAGFDLFEFTTRCVIESVFVPETGEKVFTDEDYDALMDTPTGGFVDQLSEYVSDMMYIDMAAKKKNSKRTTKGN